MAAIAHTAQIPRTRRMARLPMLARRTTSVLALAGWTLLHGACTALPPAVAALPWQDQWGDRGAQVLARDHAWCGELVEQRSQLPGCMQARGWTLAR